MDTDKIEECLDTLDKMMNFFGADESDKTPRAVTAAREQLAALKQAEMAAVMDLGKCPIPGHSDIEYRIGCCQVEGNIPPWSRTRNDLTGPFGQWVLRRVAEILKIPYCDPGPAVEIVEFGVCPHNEYTYRLAGGEVESSIDGSEWAASKAFCNPSHFTSHQKVRDWLLSKIAEHYGIPMADPAELAKLRAKVERYGTLWRTIKNSLYAIGVND